MKIEVKKIDATVREVSVEVSGEVVKNKFEDAFKKIGLQAKVPGFRVGHAPRDILEKHYSAHAHEEVLRELVPDVYSQAIDKEKLEVVELPEIFDVKLDRSSLSFKAKVEVGPEITVENYKGIKINYQKLKVSEDEIKRSIDALKESRKLEAADDSLARSLSYPSLIELGQAIQRQIFGQKEREQRERIENEIIEAVTKGMDFKLPQRLVDRQLQDLLKQAKLDLALRGVPAEKIEEETKRMSQELEPQAKRQVKVYLVLLAIAKSENITQDDHMSRRVMEFLLKEADWLQQA